MDRREFEDLVTEALDGLPECFRKHLENVAVVIEDQPTPSLLRGMGLNPKRDMLFGLYEGVPLTEREGNYGMTLPDRITIFYRPLARTFRSRAAIRREIQKTVIHEIGHFFGLDEEDIEAEGY
jgi:predicted Zn-dependent protease with MMP-like domain